MAIRRPSISSPTWVFQDFLYMPAEMPGAEELRYVEVKWDGAVYTRVSQTFDYSNPPYPDNLQRGGNIVARVDYTVQERLITIDSWEVTWQDEWPLRLAVNYLVNCLYKPEQGYSTRVQKTNIDIAFWQSENFFPTDNLFNYFSLDPVVQGEPPSYLLYKAPRQSDNGLF